MGELPFAENHRENTYPYISNLFLPEIEGTWHAEEIAEVPSHHVPFDAVLAQQGQDTARYGPVGP